MDEAELLGQFSLAREHFEKELFPLIRPISVQIAPPSCLRTGYNRKTLEVIFCPTQKVLKAGLKSKDVIHHEFFHAFLCQTRPALCQDDNYDFLHEALADKFSYELTPDDFFGEDYYVIHPYIRKYDSTWRVGLVKSEHEKGNALVADFIRRDLSLKEILTHFQNPLPLSEVQIQVEGRRASELNRYRLKKDEILKLSFQFTSSAPVAEVKWLTPTGLIVEDKNSFHFEIQVTPELKQSKTLVIYLSADGEEMGREAFYFGPEI